VDAGDHRPLGGAAVPAQLLDLARQRPAPCQARSTARRWPIGLGAVIPLPLPSLEPPTPRTTA